MIKFSLQKPTLSPQDWKKQWAVLQFYPLQLRTSLSKTYQNVKMNIKMESQFPLRL